MKLALMLGGLVLCGAAQAASGPVSVAMNVVDEQGVGAGAGEVVITETPYGLVFTPALAGLPGGIHGFHVHEKAACGPGMTDGKQVAAQAAGGHFDPEKTGRHAGPYGDGHLGDLPALYVNADGKATYPVLAPRLRTIDRIRGHALMVHAGGDNHADHPAPLGGGGGRIVCGVIK
ncbi:superoxide dismutase family protein [Herbaspirillum sp. YR522]|uniref:superoxide dismutase family protein n=1 Tax=Herbaspirillum sp. YR522 TaxID=1144342 RepID=UPI00026FCDA8|nr:superoxide dismutase family protein [Herbaspirillum sp. YR522]EJM97636.1 Cu/Zn superoxide dismutase [Herbaspirillum sp. YR522]